MVTARYGCLEYGYSGLRLPRVWLQRVTVAQNITPGYGCVAYGYNGLWVLSKWIQLFTSIYPMVTEGYSGLREL